MAKTTKKATKETNLLTVDVPKDFEGEVSISHTHATPRVTPLDYADLNTVKDKINEIINLING